MERHSSKVLISIHTEGLRKHDEQLSVQAMQLSGVIYLSVQNVREFVVCSLWFTYKKCNLNV